MAAPIVIAAGHVLAWVISSLIFKVFAALGIGYVVMTGVGSLLDGILAEIQGLSGGLDANSIAILGMLRIDDAISVIFAAVAVRISLKTFGVSGGPIRQLVFGKPAGGA